MTQNLIVQINNFVEMLIKNEQNELLFCINNEINIVSLTITLQVFHHNIIIFSFHFKTQISSFV